MERNLSGDFSSNSLESALDDRMESFHLFVREETMREEG